MRLFAYNLTGLTQLQSAGAFYVAPGRAVLLNFN